MQKKKEEEKLSKDSDTNKPTASFLPRSQKKEPGALHISSDLVFFGTTSQNCYVWSWEGSKQCCPPASTMYGW